MIGMVVDMDMDVDAGHRVMRIVVIGIMPIVMMILGVSTWHLFSTV